MLSEKTKEHVINGVNFIVSKEGPEPLMENIPGFIDSILEPLLPHHRDELRLFIQKDIAANRREVEQIIAGLLGMM